MLTRRNSIVLTAKGLAGLIAAGPFLAGCREIMDDTSAPINHDRRAMDVVSDSPDDSAIAADSDSSPKSDIRSQSNDTQALDASPRADVPHIDSRLPAQEPLDWDAFLSELALLAEQQFSPEWDQSTYVDEVGALMQLLNLQDDQFQALYDGYATAGSLFPELNTAHDGGYFEVATLEFDAGDRIDLHNHPDMTGVILVLEGALEVEAFNLLTDTSDQGALLLERVVDRTVMPGEYCTLTATHGNIHSVKAQTFTQLLDVFTPPYNDERLTRYRWYERAAAPYAADNIFEAWEL